MPLVYGRIAPLTHSMKASKYSVPPMPAESAARRAVNELRRTRSTMETTRRMDGIVHHRNTSLLSTSASFHGRHRGDGEGDPTHTLSERVMRLNQTVRAPSNVELPLTATTVMHKIKTVKFQKAAKARTAVVARGDTPGSEGGLMVAAERWEYGIHACEALEGRGQRRDKRAMVRSWTCWGSCRNVERRTCEDNDGGPLFVKCRRNSPYTTPSPSVTILRPRCPSSQRGMHGRAGRQPNSAGRHWPARCNLTCQGGCCSEGAKDSITGYCC